MPVQFIRKVRDRQPSSLVNLSQEFRAKKPIAAFLPGISNTELVNGVAFVDRNSPTKNNILGLKTLVSTTFGASYKGIKAPESADGSRSDLLYAPVAPPITIITVCTTNTNYGYAIGRGNGSGNPAFGSGAWYGSYKGGTGIVRTSGGVLSLDPSTSYIDTSTIPVVTVFSIGQTETRLWCGRIRGICFQEQSGTTPSGNFYYEYGDDYRLMSVAGGYTFSSTNVALAAIFGVEFSRADALSIINNPWQIFEPETIPLFFSTVTAQYARPTSDVSAGTWTASSGSDLFAMLDETSANDADYITTTGASTCEVALGSLSDPASSAGHVVRYRISSTGGGITVRLRQGTTTIATWAHSPAPTSLTTYTQTLSSGEADSITDYSALRLQFEATA